MENTMTLDRRQFFEISSKGALGVALLAAEVTATGFLITGCGAITLQDVINWTNIGAAAVQTALTILSIAGVVCAACAVAAPIVIAAIHAIASAVQEWESADPTQKATLWDKVKLAMQTAIDQAKAFFANVSVPGGTVATTILGIAGLIINTILGFIQHFFPTLSASLKVEYKVGTMLIPIAPKELKPGDFKKQFNSIVTAGGYPKLVMQ